jgi:hypothetical protein
MRTNAMSKTITIKLGGIEYRIPALSVGQVKRAGACTHDDGQIDVLGFLQIALERAMPKCPCFDEVEFDAEEIDAAVKQIAGFCRLAAKRQPPSTRSHALR